MSTIEKAINRNETEINKMPNDNENANYKFKMFLLKIQFCGLSVAIYESQTDYSIVIEDESGKPSRKHFGTNILKSMCNDGIVQKLVELYVSNENDLHYNSVSVVSEVIAAHEKIDTAG